MLTTCSKLDSKQKQAGLKLTSDLRVNEKAHRQAYGATSGIPVFLMRACNCPSCDDCLQPKSKTQPPASTVSNYLRNLHGKGTSLASRERQFFEPKYGESFKDVKIHNDYASHQSAKMIQAKAYTVGRNIIFGANQFNTSTIEGKRLLGHELTHVIQQRRSAGIFSPQKKAWHEPHHVTEKEADHAADTVCKGGTYKVNQTATAPIARDELNPTDISGDIDFDARSPRGRLTRLRVMGNQSGHIAHAAACPSPGRSTQRRGHRFDPDPVPTDNTLPINAHFFPSPLQTNDRALIVGGLHGSEIPGYQMVNEFVRELQGGTTPSGFVLSFHTFIVPEVNRGAIEDLRASNNTCPVAGAGDRSYNPRCNRQDVDLNRNFPVSGLPASARGSPVCHSTRLAPTQPEVQGLVNVINAFRPNRILTTHAISRASRSGIFADPNTHPGATALACALAGQLRHRSDRQANRLTRSGRCNAVYPGDVRGALPSSASLGRYGWDIGQPDRPVTPVITLEAPRYGRLATGGGPRSVEEFLRPLRAFVGGTAATVDPTDAAIVRDIRAMADPMRRLFLTGRLPSPNPIYRRIQSRIQTQIRALNSLRPRRPVSIRAISTRRMFSQRISSATPQAQIVFDKFTMTGSKVNGWDTLPDRFFNGPGRSGGVNHTAWNGTPSADRLRIILEFSALPGASRHHWGTDVDFNSTNTADWGATSGPRGGPGRFYRLGQWLQENAPRVGFLQVYTQLRPPGGHHEEPWHFSYEPIAAPLRTLYNTDIDQALDVVTPIMSDWRARAASAGVPIPRDLESALLGLNLSNYVNIIGRGL